MFQLLPVRIVRLAADGVARVRVFPCKYDPDVRDPARVHALLLLGGATRDYQKSQYRQW